MTKDNDYCLTQEASCDNWFEGFAKHFFAEAGRQEDFAIDWTATTKNNISAVIELKERYYPSTLPTAWIECYKLKQLENQRDYHDKLALYINKWNDNVISVHVIDKEHLREYNVTIQRAGNKGYQSTTESGKAELDMRDAFLFDATTYKPIRQPIHE